MINLIVQKNPLVSVQISPMRMLAYAATLVKLAEEKDGLPVSLVVPSDGKTKEWRLPIEDAHAAFLVAKCLIDGVKSCDEVEQAMRRQAGVSPISEEIELIMDAKGEPIAARKKLRY